MNTNEERSDMDKKPTEKWVPEKTTEYDYPIAFEMGMDMKQARAMERLRRRAMKEPTRARS